MLDCLTYTTCSTVHIHSFHKKYIFVYTAFTISYNRAVAGTSVWMDVFVAMICSIRKTKAVLLSYSNPNIMHHIIHNSSCICSPAAICWAISPFESPRDPSVLSVVVSTQCNPQCWAPVTWFREAADEPSHLSCPLPSSSQPPASITSSLCLVSC